MDRQRSILWAKEPERSLFCVLTAKRDEDSFANGHEGKHPFAPVNMIRHWVSVCIFSVLLIRTASHPKAAENTSCSGFLPL